LEQGWEENRVVQARLEAEMGKTPPLRPGSDRWAGQDPIHGTPEQTEEVGRSRESNRKTGSPRGASDVVRRRFRGAEGRWGVGEFRLEKIGMMK
jgi:hypothetical protein